jgi:hypothetical protein
MTHIFISYSRKDAAFARRLAESLSHLGADLWLDVEDIPAGMNWRSAIQEGLDTAQLMLVVISPDAMKSVNVEHEWQYFMDEGKTIIPVLWRTAKLHFQLRSLQWVDFQNQPYDAAFDKLLDELKKYGFGTTSDARSPVRPVAKQPAPINWTKWSVIAAFLAVLATVSVPFLEQALQQPTPTTAPTIPSAILASETPLLAATDDPTAAPSLTVESTDVASPTPVPTSTMQPELGGTTNPDSMATLDDFQAWRQTNGYETVRVNTTLQRLAERHVNYISNIATSGQNDTTIYRDEQGRNPQNMAIFAGYNGEVVMAVLAQDHQPSLSELLDQLNRGMDGTPGQETYSQFGWGAVETISSGRHYLVVILGKEGG